MSRKEDPRVIRTQSMITQSLTHLMSETPYRKIRIADIAAHAQIARQTFYLHYGSKDDVLLDYINNVFEDFYASIEAHIVASAEPDSVIAWHLFNQWKTHSEFATLIVSADISHLVVACFKNYIARIMGLYIRNHEVTLKDPEALGFIVDYLAGASWMMLTRWIESDFEYSLDKIAKLYSEITRPGILKILTQGGEV
ncbi:Uncharacterised protein [BD1-7 clade bacterium]|uniref:HTH tetR-type domain-containing protein n=1 Tax=BD1-7 clade bacterium TaxID=2029982 RepID=A0A5S9Q6Q1_9GAMM|nr:Uncharacterised protein [BD1-7 clade bacterium]CAA0112935.1 Uncharacterised protein [BD1-7 clade bacterium]